MTDLAALFGLAGRTALVTGGGRGIGAVIAATLVDAGARVYISSRDEGACADTAQQLSARGSCAPLSEDLSTMAGIERLVARFGEREERLDILVNNAGTAWDAPLGAHSADAWDKVMDLNLRSVFLLTQALLPALRRAARERPARVVNIGSTVGLKPPAMPTYAYTVSKAAVHSLTRMLALHLAPENILVNAIAPGLFATRMMEATLAQSESELVSKVPLARIGADDDLAAAILYFCSRGGTYVTGHILPVDGGLSVS